jgi:hypothetical protein
MELSPQALELATQCFCAACADLFRQTGVDLDEVRRVTARSAGPPFGDGHGQGADSSVETLLPRVRSHGVRKLLDAVVPVARSRGARVDVLAFAYPTATKLELQGLDAAGIENVDRVTVGLLARSYPA